VQNKTNLAQAMWNTSASNIVASGSTASFTDTIGPDRRRFYRVALVSPPASHVVKNKSGMVFGPVSMGTNYLRAASP
jgi:hypothetical protein